MNNYVFMVYDKAYYERHKEEIKIKARKEYAKHPEKFRERVAKSVKKYPDRLPNYQREWQHKYRQALMNILGYKCVKCGYNEDKRILQIDHIHGHGNQDRKNKGGLVRFYRYYTIHPNEVREKLQILCPNCNWIKRMDEKQHRKKRLICEN